MSTITLTASPTSKYNPAVLAILRISRLLRLSTSKNEQVSFVYKLGGGPSEIDVFALAPTLLALGKLIQESNQTLYPEGHQVAVNVKPFKEGSFVVDVVLFHSEAFYPIFAIGKDIPPQQILELLSFIGFIKGTGVVAKTANSVLDVIKKLKAKPAKIEQLKGGDYRYTAGDKSITVNAPVHKLVQNNEVTINVYNSFAKPLEETGFEAVESYLEGSEQQTRSTVTKDDISALRAFASSTRGEERLQENLQENVLLNPKRGAFEGDGSSWSFHRGSDVITATIRDQSFLKKIEMGEIRPNHADLMRVTIKETQKIVGTQIKSAKYEILEVAEYKIGPRQMNMDTPLIGGGQTRLELSEGEQSKKSLPPAPGSSTDQ
jgi:hypothetical protein